MLITFPQAKDLHKTTNCMECNKMLVDQVFTLTISHNAQIMCKDCAKILCEEIKILENFLQKDKK